MAVNLRSCLTLFCLRVAACGFTAIVSVGSVLGQSTDQTYPTPVKTNQIGGVIRARDIGDPRLTSYYYTFDGDQGDLFINVQTTNFTGDIDVFTVDGLRPLTKMVLFADLSVSETGRVIYLRKPERLLLRIQGRTPGDEAATFRIKFAGGFLASKIDDESVPEPPTVSGGNTAGVPVNSVGTILPISPVKKDTSDADVPDSEALEESSKKRKEAVEDPSDTKSRSAGSDPRKASIPEVIVSDPVVAENKAPKRKPAENKKPARPPENSKSSGKRVKNEASKPETESKETPSRTKKRAAAEPKKKDESTATADPMANVRLVIYFKDGGKIDRPMTEVFKFSVERLVLTVISKDGTIGRYKMTDVARVSIE